MRHVQRQLTEDATELIRRTYADYATMIAGLPRARGRGLVAASRLGVQDPWSVSRQSCLFRTVCIVEAYLDLLSSDLFTEGSPPGHELTQRLVAQVERRSSSTWKERKDAFATLHLLSLGTLAGWESLDAAIQARNAIAHGLGTLTVRQRDGKTRDKLAKISVRVRAHQLLVTDEALVTCRDAAVTFIEAVDSNCT